MYSDKLLKVAKERGYEFKKTLKNLDGYCIVTELTNGERSILVSRCSSIEKFKRDEDDIINDILHPINYGKEFDKIFGIA